MGHGTNVGHVDLAATATSHRTTTETAGASMAGNSSISVGAHAATKTTAVGTSSRRSKTRLGLTVLKTSLVYDYASDDPRVNLPREHRQVCP